MSPSSKLLTAACTFVFCATTPRLLVAQTATLLRDGWKVQSAEMVGATGAEVSRPGFATTGWLDASVPSTVTAVLVDNRSSPDPYFGMNLRKLAGMSYELGENFSKVEMSPDSPFARPWRYRTEFRAPKTAGATTYWLDFDGINYRANIWLNGRQVADKKTIAGAFRRYDLDVSALVRPGETNALAIEIFAPKAHELGITWVDWNPAPPDKNMGLWQSATLTTTGPVALRSAFVQTALDLPSLATAHLTVSALLKNASPRPFAGELRAQIRGAATPIGLAAPVLLAAGETREIILRPESFPALNVKGPKLWWPYTYGEPYLHTLSLELVDEGGAVSDRQIAQFGIVQIDSELTPTGGRLFRVNGRPILVRGGGWAPDMLWRQSPERREAEFRYVKDMRLNTIRLEGKLEDDDFFDLADREGILVMAGWCCCDHWEKWSAWSDEDRQVAALSLKDQAERLRRHPSLLAWLNGSDNPPPADVERTYLDVLKKARWPRPVVSSATQKPTEVTGPTGVKMSGPYDYVPPSYWLTDTKAGGAFGFNTETSPGAAPLPVESLKKMLPDDQLWPINEQWSFHAGGGKFRTLDRFSTALEARYGKAKSLADFTWKAQAMTYEGERAMFEAYGRNKFVATGVIQWMLNNAWPSLIWHLYDYYLRPAGGYFGTKKALEPLHIQYSYDDQSVVVVSELPVVTTGLVATATVFDLALNKKFSDHKRLDAAADSVTRVLTVAAPGDIGTTYLLRLDLADRAGKSLSHNFYWLSKKSDVFDWAATDWFHTPVLQSADLEALQDLPPARLQIAARFADQGAEQSAHITVKNLGANLSFLTHLEVLAGKNGPEVLPALYEDNYFELWPGEERIVVARYRRADLGTAHAVVQVDGWNVAPLTAFDQGH